MAVLKQAKVYDPSLAHKTLGAARLADSDSMVGETVAASSAADDGRALPAAPGGAACTSASRALLVELGFADAGGCDALAEALQVSSSGSSRGRSSDGCDAGGSDDGSAGTVLPAPWSYGGSGGSSSGAGEARLEGDQGVGPAATARHAGDALLDAASDLRTGSDCDSGPGTGARPLGKATSIQRRSAQMQAAAAQLACALGQEAQGDPGRQAAEEAAVMLLQLARHVDLLQRGNDSLAANVAALRRGGALAPAAGGPQPEQGLALAEQGAAAASGGGSSAAPVQGPISGAEAGEQAAVHVAARVQELETRASELALQLAAEQARRLGSGGGLQEPWRPPAAAEAMRLAAAGGQAEATALRDAVACRELAQLRAAVRGLEERLAGVVAEQELWRQGFGLGVSVSAGAPWLQGGEVTLMCNPVYDCNAAA